jgi:predicted metal-binding membrane protein
VSLARLRGRKIHTHGCRASFPANVLRRLGAALRRQRGRDYRFARIHAGGERDAEAQPISMAWMRMPGQTWAAAAVSFLRMWVVMMLAMILPSPVPMLWH